MTLAAAASRGFEGNAGARVCVYDAERMVFVGSRASDGQAAGVGHNSTGEFAGVRLDIEPHDRAGRTFDSDASRRGWRSVYGDAGTMLFGRIARRSDGFFGGAANTTGYESGENDSKFEFPFHRSYLDIRRLKAIPPLAVNDGA